jgi:hypothetical protein
VRRQRHANLSIVSPTGAVVGAVALSTDCEDQTYSYCPPAAAGAVGGGLVYGGIGALIDHFIKGRTVVFRVQGTAFRLSPGFSVGQREVRASIVFSTR